MMRFAKNLVAAVAVTFGMVGAGTAAPLAAQIQSVDPNDAYEAPIDGDLELPPQDPTYEVQGEIPADSGDNVNYPDGAPAADTVPQWSEQSPEAAAGQAVDNATVEDPSTTYREDDLIGAAEGVFGKGAEGVAKMIRKMLADQGEPNGYIVGREAGGAFIVGARYGSGTLFHKVEGQMPVYWTGPSIGFDAGANAGSTFVLVYNLYDTEELYERYPAAEGQLYAVGGLNASYLRKGDVVLIPIRVGAGLRLGVNAGYMRFSKKQRWVPF